MNVRPLATCIAVAGLLGCGRSGGVSSATSGEPASPPATAASSAPVVSSAPSASAASKESLVQPAPTTVDALGCSLAVALVPDAATALVGEPIYVTLRLSTTCAKKLFVLDGGDYRNQFGRPDSFEVTMVDAAGNAVKALDAGMAFGGLIGPREISNEKPFEKRLLLAHWFEPQPAGRYTVTVAKKLLVGEKSSPDSNDKTPVPVRVSALVDFRAGSAAELGAVIDRIGAKTLATDDAADEAIRALTMIRDERTVPYFVKLAASGRESVRIYGVWGLRPYGSDEALRALEASLGEKNLAIAAAQTIAENPHPRAWDTLWKNRAHADDNVRLTVLHALAKKKDLPDQKQRLQSFTKDSYPLVRQEAARYLQELASAK